jgi:hypothetical protein
MLGVYDGFPENVIEATYFAVKVSSKKLQQALMKTLFKLNNENCDLETITYPIMHQCLIGFEFGIAEGKVFNYINVDRMNGLVKSIKQKPFQIMDFLCVLRYNKMQVERRIPLRFDYYMLRFAFDEESTSLWTFHERGPRYISHKDVAKFIMIRVNEVSQKQIMNIVENY